MSRRKVNSNSHRFAKLGTTVFYFVAAIAILAAVFPKLYEFKTKAGINISARYHAGSFLEKHTLGLFRCEWLYPYHCDRHNGKV
ncbi:hypothetical protein [Nostoc sp. PCC 7107]|uniref:hypothetical protein n=1 Tax=Nostoc sp. PCC 7107 TaxID=317936 RepID=UPI00029EF7B1|nr:hypothetical protein [Nostoc sp. PCC 7107]AFY40705.1 hypothetical protein Nos7107_0013 [Nostoc sp. PCC 7107]